jgi:hypothetical protein
MAISLQVSPASLLGVSVGYCSTALVDESGMIRTQMGTHNRLEMVAITGTPWAIPPRNSNSKGCRLLYIPPRRLRSTYIVRNINTDWQELKQTRLRSHSLYTGTSTRKPGFNYRAVHMRFSVACLPENSACS